MSRPERPRQELPEDIIRDVLGAIRGQFYGDAPAKAWFQDRNFHLKRFVTWPAAWLNRRGVTLPPARYRAILMEVLQEVKRHGDTGSVRYWPGYLAKVIQDHFKHHGETYYEEGKSLRAQVERGLLAFRRSAGSRPAADPVETLAQVNQAIQIRRRPKPRKDGGQLGLDL